MPLYCSYDNMAVLLLTHNPGWSAKGGGKAPMGSGHPAHVPCAFSERRQVPRSSDADVVMGNGGFHNNVAPLRKFGIPQRFWTHSYLMLIGVGSQKNEAIICPSSDPRVARHTITLSKTELTDARRPVPSALGFWLLQRLKSYRRA